MNNQSDRDILIEVSTLVRSMHDRLFGDGETGQIPKMELKIEDLQSDRSRFLGAISVASFLILVFGGILLAHILGGK